MRRTTTINKIKDIVRRISPQAKVILFGSQARNEARPDSDIDILILLDKSKISYQDKIEITDPLFDLEEEEKVMISPLVYSIDEWLNRPIKSPFYMNVINEGIEL